ncbi:hypothetical protein F5X99DRAFT_407812 [Biscogniauxia marginata]|nr:hypothetical protein F5X99DRAFT_407812 [Biscogniauxia marginata]
MSADLFAELIDFSQPPRQQNQSKPPTQQPPSFTPDPFSFLSNSSANNTTNKQGQPWGNLPSQPNRGSGQWQGGNQHSPGLNGWTGSSITTASPIISTQGEDDDDDGWGDFEVAPSAVQLSTPAPAPPTTTTIPPNAAPAGSTVVPNPAVQRARIVRAPTIDLISNNLLHSPAVSDKPASQAWNRDPFQQFQQSSSTASAQRAPPKRLTKADPNVLFDADDFQQGDDDDDFGEFETVASPAQPPPDFSSNGLSKSASNTDTKASQLLLGLDLNGSTSPYPQAPRSPAFHARNPFPGLAVATPPETQKQPGDEPKKTPQTAWPSMDEMPSAASNEFGDWGAFDDFPDESAKPSAKPDDSKWDWESVEPAQSVNPTWSAKPTKIAPATGPVTAAKRANSTDNADPTWDWDPSDTKSETPTESKKDGPPPINIPPPSVLLSVFPQLFDDANTFLYKPVSGQPFSIKNRILSDPKTLEFLRGHLKLATVAARIIAGRKMRWHRDKFLSQSMSISIAGSKGMKLAGVDKAQTVREEREATDVVSNWKDNVGRLRSAIAAANSSLKDGAKQLKIPEISENMPIQTAKMVPTAPKACIVCGLKRNERISKVDYEVEDSFGEWWVDHWGHLDCKRFWLQHENDLRQR